MDDDDGLMTRKYFLAYTQTEVQQFYDTLIQHIESIKKSIDEREQHKREYHNKVNERQMHTTEGKVDMCKALDASLVNIESSGTKSGEQDTSSRLGNDTYDDDSIENADLKAQIQEKVFATAALKNELRKLKGNSVDTRFSKPSILGKPILQPLKNQSVVRQPTTFKSERPRISKPWFAFQVYVENDLSKPVNPHYLPKVLESVFAKPNHVIASSEFRNSSKNMPRFSSNYMVHNHYLEEARKKTQQKGRNLEPREVPSGRSKSTTNDNKPKPKIKNQKPRNWHASESSCVTVINGKFS
ncbi:hypothetical protein Tco_0932026 [Tanacetum coccineum]